MTAAGRFARILVLLAVVAAPATLAPVPAAAQDVCGGGGSNSFFSCMAIMLGLVQLSLSPEEHRARHEDAIQDIRDKWGDNQMMAAREIAQYRHNHNLDVFNRPILGANPPQSLTADSVARAVGPPGGGSTANDPVEMCWGGSMIKRSECPPRPGP